MKPTESPLSKPLSLGLTIKQAHDLTTKSLQEVLNLIATHAKFNEQSKDSAAFFLPSGTFKSNANDSTQVINYSGIICIDIDNVDQSDTFQIKEHITKTYKEQGLIASISSISNNIYLLFNTNNTDPSKHTIFYDTIYTDVLYFFNTHYPTTKVDYLPNLNRARFFSHDPSLNLDSSHTITTYKVSDSLKMWVKRSLTNKQQNKTSQSPNQNVGKNNQNQSTLTNTQVAFHLATSWATNKHGKFNYKESGNRNQFIHDFASATNNMGVPKAETAEYIQNNFFTNKSTGEQYPIDNEFKRAINNGYSRTDQFGTYILHSELSLTQRLEEHINKKMMYLSKIDENKSLPLLAEIQLMFDVLSQLNKNNSN